MTTIIFDLETNGLPKMFGFDRYHPAYQTDYYDSSRIIEIGYYVCDESGNILKSYNELVKPVGFKIENSHIHGISYDDAKENGKPIDDILDDIFCDFMDMGMLVAHNINFDYNVLLSECHRAGHPLKDILPQKQQFCTCKFGQVYLQQRKWPKLVELYQNLFGEVITQTHRALDDVDICKRCYFKMLDT